MKSSTVVKLVPVLILAMVGGSIWFVMETNKTNDKVNNDTVALSETVKASTLETADYKDTASKYTLKYPKTWKETTETFVGEGDSPDPTVTSRAVTFTPLNAPENNAVRAVYLNDPSAIANITQNWQDNKHPIKTTKINGYDVKYIIYTFKGDAEGFTGHEYLLTKADKAVLLTFRSKYHHDNVTPKSNWDDSKDLPGFLQIVQSVKFL